MINSIKVQEKINKDINRWYQRPLQTRIISAILTGLVFALVLQCYDRIQEKKDVEASLEAELRYNYNILNSIQKLDRVESLDTDDVNEDDILRAFHNMPVDDQLSLSNWISLETKISKYPQDYSRYKTIYTILERIIKFSKIKTGERQGTIAEKFAVEDQNAISENSKEFIEKFEENFKSTK